MEYKELKLTELKPFKIRDLRDNVIIKLTERIKKRFNLARPLSVVKDNDNYIIADGNHRYKVLKELDIKKVPCVIYEDRDPYNLAVECNQDEDTYAPMDLFDWLDIIGRLKDDYTQEEIGNKIGWSRSKVKKYSALLSNIKVPEVREISKKYQKDRGTNEVPNGTFNFTERWFRDSGIYDLNKDNQLEFMEWFTKTKKCKAGKRQVQKKTESLKEIQEQIELLVSEMPEIEEKEREENKLKEAIKNGEYTTGRLKEVIEKYKNKAKNKALFGVAALEEIKKLEPNSVDCVIFDPPWGIGFKNFRDNEKPDYGLEMNEVEDLLTTAVTEIKRVSKANAHIYTFFSMEVFEKFYNLLDKNFITNKTPLIWAKNNHNPCDYKNKYAQIYEPILFCKNENEKRKLNNSVSPNVLNFDKVNGQDKYHDSQKPIELMEYLIKNSTSVKETVLDPFMGSGVSLLAAAKNDRHFIGFEKETVYEGNFKRILSEM